MGRGNCRVTGKYEGLFYIDNDDIDGYLPETGMNGSGAVKWIRDEDESKINWQIIIENFCICIEQRFPSFTVCGKQISPKQSAILANNLFYIAVEDNEWSVAVELLQKENFSDYGLEGLQKLHFQQYLDGIEESLFEQFETIGVYAGPWTSGTIRKNDRTKEAS